MVTRIRKGAREHLYIEEWMERRGLTDEKVARRIGVERPTITRWRNQQHRLNPAKIAALAQALDLEPEDLWRPPPPLDAPPSIDAMLRDEPDHIRRRAAEVIRQAFKAS